MSNLTIVPLFTPVETEHQWTSWPARFIAPFFCTKQIAVLKAADSDARICDLKKYETKGAITAIKIAAYILSAGTFLLLACVANLVIRCVSGSFYRAPSQPPQPDPIQLSGDEIEVDARDTADLVIAKANEYRTSLGQDPEILTAARNDALEGSVERQAIELLLAEVGITIAPPRVEEENSALSEADQVTFRRIELEESLGTDVGVLSESLRGSEAGSITYKAIVQLLAQAIRGVQPPPEGGRAPEVGGADQAYQNRLNSKKEELQAMSLLDLKLSQMQLAQDDDFLVRAHELAIVAKMAGAGLIENQNQIGERLPNAIIQELVSMSQEGFDAINERVAYVGETLSSAQCEFLTPLLNTATDQRPAQEDQSEEIFADTPSEEGEGAENLEDVAEPGAVPPGSGNLVVEQPPGGPALEPVNENEPGSAPVEPEVPVVSVPSTNPWKQMSNADREARKAARAAAAALRPAEQAQQPGSVRPDRVPVSPDRWKEIAATARAAREARRAEAAKTVAEASQVPLAPVQQQEVVVNQNMASNSSISLRATLATKRKPATRQAFNPNLGVVMEDVAAPAIQTLADVVALATASQQQSQVDASNLPPVPGGPQPEPVKPKRRLNLGRQFMNKAKELGAQMQGSPLQQIAGIVSQGQPDPTQPLVDAPANDGAPVVPPTQPPQTQQAEKLQGELKAARAEAAAKRAAAKAKENAAPPQAPPKEPKNDNLGSWASKSD